jgi:diguanylate cyclase (GGDEF)-like protein
MKRTSVQTPIILGFGAMLLILATVVLANIYQIHVFSEHIRTIVLERNKKSDLAALMNELHRNRYRALVHATALSDPFERDDEIRYFREMAGEFIKARDQFTSLPLDESELATWESIRAEVRKVEAESEVIVDYLQADYLDTAKTLIKNRLAPLQDSMMAGWNQMLYVQNEKNKAALRESNAMDSELRQLSIILGAIATLVGFSVAAFAIRTSRRLEADLQEEKERAQITLEAISEAVIRINPQGEICYLNPYAEFLLGMQLPEGGCGEISAVQLLDKNSRTSLLEPMLADLRRNLKLSLPANACLVTTQGMEYDVEGSGAPMRMGTTEAPGAVIVLRDVTEMRNSLRSQGGCAGIDPITGLTDSLVLEDRLSSALRGKRSEDQPLAFLLVRFDNLDDISAVAGNSSIDLVFRQTTHLLQLRIRDSDLLCRYDNTGFGILLTKCPEAKAMDIADDILRSIEQYRLRIDQHSLSVKAHIGRVLIPPFAGTLYDCLRAAGAR